MEDAGARRGHGGSVPVPSASDQRRVVHDCIRALGKVRRRHYRSLLGVAKACWMREKEAEAPAGGGQARGKAAEREIRGEEASLPPLHRPLSRRAVSSSGRHRMPHASIPSPTVGSLRHHPP